MKDNDRAREGTGVAGTHLINPRHTPKLTISYKGTDKNIAINVFGRHVSTDCDAWTAVRKKNEKQIHKMMGKPETQRKVVFPSFFSVIVRKQFTDEIYMLSGYRGPTSFQERYCRRINERRNEPFLYSQSHPLKKTPQESMINQKNLLNLKEETQSKHHLKQYIQKKEIISRQVRDVRMKKNNPTQPNQEKKEDPKPGSKIQ